MDDTAVSERTAHATSTKVKTKSIKPVDDELLTVNDVAHHCKVHRAEVYRWMRDGKLHYILVGTRRRVKMSELERFLAHDAA